MKHLFTVIAFAIFLVNSLVAQTVTKQCTPTAFYYSCGATSAHQSQQGPWMDFVVNGNQSSWYQGYSVANATWKEFDNGTAQLSVRLTQIIDANVKWDLILNFSNRTTSYTPHGGDDGWHCLPSSTADWYYYKTATGTLTGVWGTKIQGAKYNATLVSNTALQIGTGGSTNSTTKYGMSAWLTLTKVTGPSVNTKLDYKNVADLYFDLTNCSNPTPTCNNFTSGGTICCDQTGCAPFDPAPINNQTLPSGGTGNTEYLWLRSTTASTYTTANANQWQAISGATSQNYDPGQLSQTTWFIRCARRSGCTDYTGESNIIKVTVNNCTPPTIVRQCTVIPDAGTCYQNVALLYLPIGKNFTLKAGAVNTFIEYSDGTAKFKATVERTDNASHIIEIDINLSGKTNTGSPKIDGDCPNFPSVNSLLTYYTNFSGTFKGIGSSNNGLLVNVNRGTYPPFQIGEGASTNGAGLGGAVWLNATVVNNVGGYANGQVDIEFNLNCGSTPPTGCPNLVTNGSFGSGFTGFQTDIVHKSGPDCSNGGAIAVRSNPNQWGFSANCPDQDGNGAQLLVDYPSGDVWQKIWSQTVTVQQNKTYTFIFWAQNIYPENPGQLYAVINSQNFPVKVLPSATCQWVKYEVQWNSGTATSANLMIKNNNIQCHGNDFGIDNISFSCDGGNTGTCNVTVNASNNSPKCTGESVQLTATATSNSTGSGGGTTYGNNLVVNGNFDAGNTGFTSELSHGCYESCGVYNINSNTNTCFHWAPNCGDHTGNGGKMMVIDAPGGDAWKVYWKQCINVEPNTTYEFSYWAMSLFGSSPARLYAVINNMNTGNVTPQTILSTTTCQWQKITFTWNSGNATQACIMIKNDNPDCGGNDFALDDISFRKVTTAQNPTCTPSYSWTGPNGFTSTQQNPIVNAAGQYRVVYKDQYCCTATATTTVSFSSTPTPSITGNLVVCNGGTTTLTAQGGTLYRWSNGAATASITVGAGTYTVTVTNLAGCTATRSVTVNNNQFTTSITGTLKVCSGATTTLTASGGGSYRWSNGATTQSVNVGAGTYTVTVTNNSCTATASATVSTSSSPNAQISGNLTVCNNGTTTLTASGGTTYAWSNGSNTASITVGVGTYTVTVTNAAGCTAIRSVTVNNNQFTTSITGNLKICNGATTTLTASGGGSYRWSNGATTQSVNVGAGTYTVTVTNNSCTATASATVSTSSSPNAQISGNLTVCNNGTTTLTASGGTTYAWSNGPNTASITVGVGTYTVTVTNADGCTATRSVTVNNTQFTTSITGTLNVCSGATTTLTASGGGSYRWSNGATTQSVNVGAGTYTVTVTNNSCTATASATVSTSSSPNAQISGNLTVCNNGTTTLTASGGTTYAWSNGSNTASITVGVGTYTVTVTNAAGCTATRSATVTNTQFTTSITGTLKVCSGATTTLTASGGGSYRWSNGATTQSVNVGAGTYTVTVTNNSCTATASATVSTSSSPNAQISGNLTVCNNGTTTLTASGGTTYAWSNGSNTASITVGVGTYTVTVTNAAGCTATRSVTVISNNCNTATVGDYVWCDKNGNGIQEIGEPGIPNVSVMLLGTDINGQSVNLTTTTNNNGFYSFTNLAAGSYSVKFTTPNSYLPTAADKGGNDNTDSDINPSTGTTPVFNLAQGQSNLTLDAGYYQPASIGDFVFADNNNNGIQETGEQGISNVTVTLTGTANDGTPVSLTTTTNNNGLYTFINLKPGSYTVNFAKPNGFNSSPSNQGTNDNLDSDADINGNVSVTVSSGTNNTTIDAGFNRPCTIDINITNKVCNNNNTPSNPDDDTYTFTLTVSGGTGTWAGSYNNPYLGVFAFAPTAYNTPIVLGPFPAGKFTSSNTIPPVVLLNGLDINIQVNDVQNPSCSKSTKVISTGPCSTATGSVGNFVWLDCNKNGIQDAGEQGLQGVSVILTNTLTGVTQSTTTNANGFYNFTNVALGTYTATFGTIKNLTFTTRDVGVNDDIDSDVSSTGVTNSFTVSGTAITNIDAGLQDNVKPTFNGIPSDITVQCNAVPVPATPTAVDNCDVSVTVTYNETILNGSCADSYAIRRVWTATDDCGNVCVSTQIVTVIDTQAPTFNINTVPVDVTLSCGAPIPSPASPTAVDNCDKSVTITFNEAMSQVVGPCPKTLIVRVWTATDNCGNSTTAAQTICIADNEGPNLANVPADVTVQCNAIPPVPNNIIATDFCSPGTSISVQFSTTTTVTQGAYLIRRIWTATDVCGNKTIRTQVICAKDTQKPTFTGVPADVTVECNAIPPAGIPVVKDNCDNKMPVTLTETRILGTCAYNYTLKREWSATDDAGNKCVVTQLVTVVDVTRPVLFNIPSDITIQCGDDIPLPPSNIYATDNCSPYVSITFSEIYFDGPCDGKSRILCQWVAKDDCGNTAVRQWNITIQGASSIAAFGKITKPNTTINSTTFNEINLFPNPTRGELNIALNGAKADRIVIFDITGRKIQDISGAFEDVVQLSLNGQQQGVYTIQLHTKEGIVTKKALLLE
jgi:hypothetical protein